MVAVLKRNRTFSYAFCRRCGQVRRFVTRSGLCQRCWTNGLLRRYHATLKMSGRCQVKDTF